MMLIRVYAASPVRISFLVSMLALGACDISSSATEREKHEEENHESIALHRKQEQWRLLRMRHVDNIRIQYNKRFEGKIVAGMGCGACPNVCGEWDLSPVAPAEFQRQMRRASRGCQTLETEPERDLSCLEVARLACVAKAGGPALHSALVGLTATNEPRGIRWEAAYRSSLHGIEPTRIMPVLRELARGEDLWARLAREELEELGARLNE